MIYEQDLQHVYADTGIDDATLNAYVPTLKKGVAKLAEWKMNRVLPMFCLPEETDDLAEIEEVGAYLRSHFAHVLVIGTGGSSLGGQTVAALHENPFAEAKKGAPRLHFLDNVDPDTMDTLLATLDLSQTGCLVISKSGSTAEIMAQMLVVLSAMKAALGETAIAKHFIGITEPKPSPLRQVCERHGVRVLDHDPKVGGRFSVLSLVGLIPAAAAGVDVRAVRRGAAYVMQTLVAAQDDPLKAPPAMGAALHAAMMDTGRNMTVVMPYCDKLAYFGMWFRQLWAESLGKDGKGSTPIRALGTVDQHSQLQLYLDGPKDKFFTFITPHAEGRGSKIDGQMISDDSLSYIRDKTIGDVMAAYQSGTLGTLVNNNCPVRVIRTGVADAELMGAFLMHFMLETILTAELMGINAYDQPAVEESKILARDYLSKQDKAA